MPLENSAKILKNLIEERLKPVQSSAQNLFLLYAKHDRSEFNEEKKRLNSNLLLLSGIFADSDRPAWIEAMVSWSAQPVEHMGTDAVKQHLVNFLRDLPHLENFTVERLNTQDSGLLDIDALLKKAEQSLHIPELFDKAIELVVSLCDHGDLDSLRTQAALVRMLRTLRVARNQPLSHKKIAAEVVFIVAGNLLKEFANSTPVLGEIIRGVTASMSEVKEKIDLVESKFVMPSLTEVKSQNEFQPKFLEKNTVVQIEDHSRKRS